MTNCKTCLLEHAEVGDDLTAELAVELSAAKAEIGRLQAENAILNVVLSHVENGLGHPDEAIGLLIQAAAREAVTGERLVNGMVLIEEEELVLYPKKVAKAAGGK